MTSPTRDSPTPTLQTQLISGFHQCLGSLTLQSPHCLVLAVSGGADSMALLDAVHQLHQTATPPLDSCTLHVVHVNHGLRVADSDADAEFVRQMCDGYQIPCTIAIANVRQQHSQAGHGSLEETARNCRYQLLLAISQQLHAAAVVTAHHRDDQVETILHNILRGTGLAGLAAMQPVRPLSPEIPLLRPMLQITRAIIMQYISQRQVPFRTDASNQEPTFLRNRIRHQLLPLLQNFNQQADQHLLNLGFQAADAAQCLDELADRVLQESLLQQTSDACRLDCRHLLNWPDFLIRHSLLQLWKRQQWPRQHMTAQHWSRLLQIVRSGKPSSASFPGGLQVSLRSHLLHLSRQKK